MDIAWFGGASAENSLDGVSSPGFFRGSGIMNCKDTIHLICWYLEGKLSPAVSAEIRRHLDRCGDCRLVLDAANSTLDRYFEGSQEPVRTANTQAA